MSSRSRSTCRTMRTPKYEQPIVLAEAVIANGQHGHGAVRRGGRELADEHVAVSAVDRAHELDDAAVVGTRGSLEEECGCVQRDAERRRLLLVRHRRLDALHAAPDHDAVAL